VPKKPIKHPVVERLMRTKTSRNTDYESHIAWSNIWISRLMVARYTIPNIESWSILSLDKECPKARVDKFILKESSDLLQHKLLHLSHILEDLFAPFPLANLTLNLYLM
jgi:hypothetical protein